MFRLLAVLLAALYFGMLHFGDETRRTTEVARAEPMPLEFVPASFEFFKSDYVSSISDDEALRTAIEAGDAVRQARKSAPDGIAVAAVDNMVSDATLTATPVTQDVTYWYVTGDRVNLRGGPGTGNAVVGQATLGAEAEILGDANGWYQIRLADGTASGWIYGRFLNENRPG